MHNILPDGGVAGLVVEDVLHLRWPQPLSRCTGQYALSQVVQEAQQILKQEIFDVAAGGHSSKAEPNVFPAPLPFFRVRFPFSIFSVVSLLFPLISIFPRTQVFSSPCFSVYSS